MANQLKILVTGARGLVGSRFVELSDNFNLLTPDLPDFNITNIDLVDDVISDFNPDWIINFAAFTDVNAAEKQSGDKTGPVWQVNVEGVRNLTSIFKSKNIIHISTDMVFPGDLSQPGPYSEDDQPPNSPEKLTWYGWTKNRAEKIILERGATVLRIIYPVRAKFGEKLDYIRGPLDRFVQGKLYPLFRDQQISISYIDEIIKTIYKIIEFNARGVYHASSDTTTPYELISRVLTELGEDSSTIESSSIHDVLKTQNNPNRYPVYGGLKTKKAEDRLRIHFSTWQTIVDKLIGDGLKLPSVK